MHPSKATKVRESERRQRESQWRGTEGVFNPNEIPYKKYFVDSDLKGVLQDFEDYMACARMGGTGSAALGAGAQHRDEDIRATIVQNVSRNLLIIDH